MDHFKKIFFYYLSRYIRNQRILKIPGQDARLQLTKQDANMNNSAEVQKITKSSHATDHLANERTFLAWIRTSIGIMAFGFVVEKFSIFIKQISLLLGRSDTQIHANGSLEGYSPIFGAILVAFGALICLLAFVQYRRIERQIEDNTYHPSILLNITLTLAVILIGIFLVVYLNSSF